MALAPTAHGKWQLYATISIGLACCVLVGLVAFTERAREGLRAWFVVAPAGIVSLAGFGMIGFLAGPAVLLTFTLMLAALLLGWRATLGLLATAVTGIGLIGWAMTQGAIPAPSLPDVSMTGATPWIRIATPMLLAIGFIGWLLVEIVGRMEGSLEQARNETLRREEAEGARARAEIMAMANKQLEAIGQLAAGVAHDFNNSLAAIISSAELMKEELHENRATPELLDDILLSSQRAAQLTRQLLVYSRRAAMVLVPIDLNQLIDNTVALFRRSVDPMIEVVTQMNADSAKVLADGALLNSALLNLLVNARDAMPHGGQLTIATSSCELTYNSTEPQHNLAPGSYVLLEVLDTGEGIASEILPNIFEPFFTTKPVGEGTGLGLAAVSSTVKALKGSIAVESEPGCGTTFRILLPSESQTDSSITRQVHQLTRGEGSILLVDDEVLVRRAAALTLRSFGYEVTLANDGMHAIEILKSSAERFDLVILDLRMPRMDGEATYEELHRLAPDIPIVIWSGYGGDRDVEALLKKGAVGFIQKPYRIEELSEMVSEAIRH